MAYPHALKIEGLTGLPESTYLTDEEPEAMDGIRGVGRLWSALGLEWAFANRREDTVSNSLIQAAPGVPIGRMVNIDYRFQLMGAGEAYSGSGTIVRPECDPIIVASGFARTHDDTGSSEKVTYDLADTGHGSATLYAYAGGKLFKIVGVRGNLTWAANPGVLGEVQFQGMGLVTEITETAVPSITYSSVVPPPAVSMGLAVVPSGGSSWTPRGTFSVTTGHEMPRLDDVSSAQGIEGWFYSATDPRCTITARAVSLTDYPAYALAAARTVQTIDATLGSTQYNRARLDIDLAYLDSDPAPTDDQGFAAQTLEFMLRDLQIEFD